MEHVGYKGSAPMQRPPAGTIKLAIDTLPQNVPFMKEGKLRARVTCPRARRWRPTPSVLELGQKKLVAENSSALGSGRCRRGSSAARGHEESAGQSDRDSASPTSASRAGT